MSGRRKGYSYIRMSTTKQLDGDSLRRQTAAAQAFCDKHDMELDTEFKLLDIGVSAYTGENFHTGDLGRFIQAVKVGLIQPGSCLIIESYDRFSRLTPRQALPHLLNVLNAGIAIAVLLENQIIEPDDPDDMKLLYALLGLKRAYDESARKAERVRAARTHRRANLDKKNMTSMAPLWLRENPDKKGFQPIPERVDVVKQMFDMALRLGDHAVMSELNRRGTKNFGPGQKGWQKSSVSKILTSRTVLGEYQPHTKVNGKRIPTGDAVAGYYPPIIDSDVFHAVQHARAIRKTAGGGRLGTNIANLFSKLARCGHCRGAMAMKNKGEKAGGRYLVCDRAARGLGCRMTPWPYRSFESSFLSLVKEIDFSAITIVHDQRDETEQQRLTVEAAKGRLLEAERRRDRAYEILYQKDATDYLREQFDAADRVVKLKRDELLAAEEAYDRLLAKTNSFKSSSSNLVRLLREHEAEGDENTFDLRSRVREAISNVVKRIYLFPAGHAMTQEQVRRVRRDLLVRMKAVMGRFPLSSARGILRNWIFSDVPNPDRRFFVVDFGDGHRVTVKPKVNDPRTFDVIRDEGADVVTHAQVREMAPKFGLDPDNREQFDEALDRLRRMTLQAAARDAAAYRVYEKALSRSTSEKEQDVTSSSSTQFGTAPSPAK